MRGKGAMISKIHKIALVTGDVEGSIRFYTQILGLEVIERFPNEDDEDFVFLKSGDIILELMPQKTMETTEGFHHISFRVESVDEAAQGLKDQSITLDQEPFDAGVGGIRLAFFKGPTGERLKLFERNT